MVMEDLGRPRRGLRSSLSQWASSDRAEARELREDAERAGLVCIADAPLRAEVTVQGTLRALTLRPRGGVSALEAELYDGTGTLRLVWLGRRRIAGVSAGRGVRVSGRIGRRDQHLVMYNPRYTLRPL